MAHVGNIHGTATMDPTGYTVGLRQMAQETYRFQQSIQSGSYGIASMGGSATRTAAHMNSLNRSVYASMTAFYMLTRQIGGAMNAYEEYDNIVARIGSTADMSTSSILGLSEALKGLNRQMAGNRTDLMKGMYRAVQAGFTSPSEFVPIAESAMRLRTASGREINTTKGADLIAGIRNSLGVKSGREGFITDMLLRGRDVGRFELNEMASALGIPLTIYGNQYSQKIGAEETLRQVVTLLAATTKANLAPNRAATGIRRMLEKSLQLAGKPDGIGKNLTTGMQGLGYKDVYAALDEGMLPYMRNLLKVTEGGSPEGLVKAGFGSREMMVTAAALSRGMSLTDPIYAKLASSEIAGTTDKYTQQQQESWWYQRDKLRSAYLDTQLSIMEAMLPTMKSFATSLEIINDLFQSLSPAVRNLLGLLAIGSAGQLMKNFFFRPQDGKGGKGGFSVPSAGAMAGVGPYAGRAASLGLTRNKSVTRELNPSPLGNRVGGPNYRYRGPSGFVKPTEYASFDPSAYVPKTAPQSAFSRNMGNAWRFTWGGQAVRDAMIGNFYNSRIEGRQADYNASRGNLEKMASGVYQKAVAGGMLPERAAAMAGNAFADSLSKMTTAMNAANKSTRFWTGAMSKLSGVMGAVGSIANMLAIGGIFQSISSFINGAKYTMQGTMTNGVMDLSKAGRAENKGWAAGLAPQKVWQTTQFGWQLLGGLFSDKPRANIGNMYEKEWDKAGYIRKSGSFGFGSDSYRPMTNDDIIQRVLMSQFAQTDRNEFYQKGYTFGMDQKLRTDFEKWLLEGGMGRPIKGVFEPGFLQRTNIEGYGTGKEFLESALPIFIKGLLDASGSLKQLSESTKQADYGMKKYTGVNLSFMEKLRGAAAPNLAAVEKFWGDAKEKGAYSTEEDYQNDLKKQFIQGGFLPDAYFQGFDGNLKLTKKIGLYDFLDYFENTEKLGPFTGLGGGLSMDPKNKKGLTFDTLKGAAALAEALPTLGSASHAEIRSLIAKIVGEDTPYNQYFEQSATSQLRLLNTSDYASLVNKGEHYTKPVQKYSDAVAFGTDAGYNATLPYWAEKGDEKQEIKIMFDKLMEFVADLKILSMKTEENTAVTASVVASQNDVEF